MSNIWGAVQLSVASGVDVGCGVNALSDLQKSRYIRLLLSQASTHCRVDIPPAIFNY
ncbi:hypothetical protein BH100L_04437 [Escherichia coli]|nr:hypothetical protein [Escherichia coli]AUQ40011.1 hypothetical protein BH100L_04437 [Escherichia coli]